jgi:hypothetical protein
MLLFWKLLNINAQGAKAAGAAKESISYDY